MTDTNQLPPLPKPDIAQHTQEVWIDDVRCTRQLGPRYTADQMRAYALQARAQVQGEPVYWEWRHLGNNQFAADFGQWSEWKRVEARNPIFTAEDELRTLRRYIADGYKYELRALHTHPSPSVPDDVVLKAKRYEWLKARNNTAQIGVGRWESDDHFTWLCDLDADEAIDAAMLAA